MDKSQLQYILGDLKVIDARLLIACHKLLDAQKAYDEANHLHLDLQEKIESLLENWDA